ncbi:MAG TPA: NUDIX domain-containing protein [Dehalococcoidia bacterium]|nr:NUDIX domain-containing protein [Dehalococcoidia bacterium]
MRRHFTVTGFVVDGDRTLLHWHRRTQMWLPPGGHVEPDEDPVQAVLREVREETGLDAEVVPGRAVMPFRAPAQLPPPYTILVEDIPEHPATGARASEAAHQHIDLIYFLRAAPGATPATGEGEPFIWVSERDLRDETPLLVASCGVDLPVPEDVRLLGLAAIAAVRAAATASA